MSLTPHKVHKEVDDKLEVSEIILGTATFSDHFKEDLWLSIRRALELGINAFDTSPYYGDSEKTLGSALYTLHEEFPRSSYYIFTKVGRYGPKDFDYTAKRIRESVKESCMRLCTNYLDVVYAHDVEFVKFEDVVGALSELIKLKEQGKIRYVGISGYPLDVLLKIARFQYERDQPIDVILSYSHYCLHNIKLADYIEEFKHAGVQYIMNASPLSMGLLRNGKPPEWHPASIGLRNAVEQSAVLAAENNFNISRLALQFSLDLDDITSTVIGLSNPIEVEEAISSLKEVQARKKGEKAISEIEKKILNEIHQILEPYFNHSWDSPPKD